MKAILIAAGMAGTAIAGLILYMQSHSRKQDKLRAPGELPDRKVDGQVREMKFSMG